MINSNNADLPAIPAQRYFSDETACFYAGISLAQLRQWQQQGGGILGKGSRTLTRLDVMKLRQMRHSINDFFAHNSLDINGNPVITATEMRDELEILLANIEKSLAK